MEPWKVVLATGQCSGIGNAIARWFLDEGAQIFAAQRSADQGFPWLAADSGDPVSAAQVVDQVT